ncbi:helix-turn-helix domain-containing protein [Actinomyces bowdenii]|uniref:helix-turn-helix domain-containing protein n=1 Tax=Actinomyces bowdenii TaxID=131109 RepID=UPI00214B2AF2|nr:helix-turn-helix transcriptional regulator [Actinomyces bowdenii]MCR2051480.1 helix-turn-helix domain-containing protein [Actinomyces bowdenii]
MNLAAEIRAEAARQGITVTALAEQAAISSRSLHRKLRGERPITLPEVQRLAAALGVPLSTLAERAEAADHAA